MKKMTGKILVNMLLCICILFGFIFSIGNAEEKIIKPGIVVPPENILKTKYILSAELNAEPVSYTGTCPATITFKGKITLTIPPAITGKGLPVVVKYKFLRSDGALDTVDRKLLFYASGTQEVIDTWQLGDIISLPNYTGWKAVSANIICPAGVDCPKVESDKAKFSIQCTTKIPYQKGNLIDLK
jgi:hypothetical protein